MTIARPDGVDLVEAGDGRLVVLVHSSMSGARQWSALMRDLETRFRVRAVNLFGYGRTPAWSSSEPPSLPDFAALVAAAVPHAAQDVVLVGHSFGGAVAMQAARQLAGRVTTLVLIEPSLFYLLDACGRDAAYSEIAAIASRTMKDVAAGRSEAAAERFIDYWCGPGTWAASPPERKASLARAISLVGHEWTVVLRGETTLAQWAAALPRCTLVVSSADTARPSRELVGLLAQACPHWELGRIAEGGHMAPLTRPELVNPVIAGFLDGSGSARAAAP